jgi:predicted RNA binding protein YcfA (HicA-like mRNA interferase family)
LPFAFSLNAARAAAVRSQLLFSVTILVTILVLDGNAHNAYAYSMTAQELVKRLEKAGFVNMHGRNHDKLAHPDGRVTVVHRHKGDIPLGTLKAIERQTHVKLT